MKSLIRGIDRISLVSGYLAGAMTFLGLLIVLVEIFVRSLFDGTTYITEEYSGYLMCGLVFCGLANTLKQNGHIRMVFIHKLFSGRPRLYLEMSCMLVSLGFCLVLIYSTMDLFWDSYVNDSQSMQITETYLAVPQFFMPLGAILLALQFVSGLMKGLLIMKGEMSPAKLLEVSDKLGR